MAQSTTTPTLLVWSDADGKLWNKSRRCATDNCHVIAIVNGGQWPHYQRWRAAIPVPVGIKETDPATTEWIKNEQTRDSNMSVYYLRLVRSKTVVKLYKPHRSFPLYQTWELDNLEVNALPIPARSVAALLPVGVQALNRRHLTFENAEVASAITQAEQRMAQYNKSGQELEGPVVPKKRGRETDGEDTSLPATKKHGGSNRSYPEGKKVTDPAKIAVNNLVASSSPRARGGRYLALDCSTYCTSAAIIQRVGSTALIDVPNNDPMTVEKMTNPPPGVTVTAESARSLLTRLPSNVKYDLAFLDYCRTFKPEAAYKPTKVNSHNPSADLHCLFAGHLAPKWCVVVNNCLRGDDVTTTETVMDVMTKEAAASKMKISHFFVKKYGGQMRCIGAIGSSDRKAMK